MKHRILLLVLAVFAVLMTTFLISCDPSADVNVTDSNEENISHEVADESESETESNLFDYISDINFE